MAFKVVAVKDLFESLLYFLSPFLEVYYFFNVGEKNISQHHNVFTKIILVVFHSWSLISSKLCSIIINRTNSLYWGYAQPESAPKELRQTR